MSLDDRYVELKGREISLAELDEDERSLLNTLKQRADRAPSWHEFANFWMKLVGEFYDGRGLSRSQVRHTALYRIAQDLASRLAVEQGVARVPDYRDEIEALVCTRFKTRREFCEATGLSEDMLSHVLAGRKHGDRYTQRRTEPDRVCSQHRASNRSQAPPAQSESRGVACGSLTVQGVREACSRRRR